MLAFVRQEQERWTEAAALAARALAAEPAPPQVAGLRAYVEGRYDAAAVLLMAVRRNEVALGGSAAKREVIEDTLLDALLAAGRLAQARSLLEHRLDRRQSRRDQRRLYQLTGFPESQPA